MTLNDEASGPHAWERVFNLKASDSAASLLSSIFMSQRMKEKLEQKCECSVLL